MPGSFRTTNDDVRKLLLAEEWWEKPESALLPDVAVDVLSRRAEEGGRIIGYGGTRLNPPRLHVWLTEWGELPSGWRAQVKRLLEQHDPGYRTALELRKVS